MENMRTDTLQTRFDDICQTFFPDFQGLGYDMEAVTSEPLARLPAELAWTDQVLAECSPDLAEALIIHEIAHIVTDCWHGPAWHEAMTRAATKAEELNRPVLARALRIHLQIYGAYG